MSQQHVDPAEAVQIHLHLGAKRSIGVRWGTFVPTDESLDQPPIALAAARAARGLAEEAFSDPRHRRDAAAAAARALKGPAAPVAG
jgi:N-acyl-phosphatidylethanolamine-hydrolysing phospholipase D